MTRTTNNDTRRNTFLFVDIDDELAGKKDDFIAECQHEFARYGFVGTPLDNDQLTALYARGTTVDDAYGIGCDVAAGFPFEEATAV